METINNLQQLFNQIGYKPSDKNKIPKSLLWLPDIILSKDGYKYLILYKSNNSIPPVFLNRIASIPKGKYIPLIIFSQKPSARDKKLINSLGISTGIHSKGKLSQFSIIKKNSNRCIQNQIKKRKLEVIDIFISSKQEIEERIFIQERIENLRRINSYPFSPPRLIEYDKFDISKLYKHIDIIMAQCEWIVILLEDNYSDVVSYEIKKAIKLIDHRNIFIFVKSTKISHEIWNNELTTIKQLENKTIKYLPYSDKSDLEVSLSRAIKTRINEICKRKKIILST